jgi:hypothetical protein
MPKGLAKRKWEEIGNGMAVRVPIHISAYFLSGARSMAQVAKPPAVPEGQD